MSTKETFNVAKTVYTNFYAYINAVAQEIGLERALALLTKTNEASGTELGKKIKEQSGGKEYDVPKTAQEVINLAKGIGGIDEVIEDTPQRVVTKTGSGKCPNYEAAKAAGLDNDTIKAICATGSLRFFDTLVKQLNPDLSYRLKKFRSGPDDFCLEETVLDVNKMQDQSNIKKM